MDIGCGCRLLNVPDPLQNTTIPLAILYPAHGRENLLHFGPYSINVALNARCVRSSLPLVIFSHGNGGTPWAYRDLAKHLVHAGFVIALPEHPGNSRNDNTLASTAANLQNRPRHLRLAIDAVLAHPELQAHLAPDAVAVIGHSIGACTALALGGAQPWAAAHETVDGRPHPVLVPTDRRLRALVLLMPATFWFPPGSLSQVHLPMLIRTGDHDEITPASSVDIILTGVPDPSRIEHTVIPGAGHFSVMSVFPPALARPDFPPSQDPPGFHREALQPTLSADIAAFLHRTLPSPAARRT